MTPVLTQPTDRQTLRHGTEPRPTLIRTLSDIRQDIRRKRLQMKRPITRLSMMTGIFSINVFAVAVWRISIWLMHAGWRFPSMLLYYVNSILFSFDGSPYSLVGEGIVIAHLSGCVLHGKFGRNCTLYGRNAVGGKGKGGDTGWLGGPIIGDQVTMGFGSSILCDKTIGSHATIGAGAWCFDTVPAQAIVVGLPARVQRFKTEEELQSEVLSHGRC